LFFVVLSCFVCNCLSKIQENGEKKFEPKMPKAWHSPCLTCHAKTQKTRTLARPVPVVARSCPTSTPHIPNFFPSFSFILQHKHLSPLKPLSKTSITTNLQTFISPSNLHQITNFLTQTIPNIIPNIIHQSKTTFIHPNQNSSKFLYPINLIQTPLILHQPTPLNSQTLLKHQPHN